MAMGDFMSEALTGALYLQRVLRANGKPKMFYSMQAMNMLLSENKPILRVSRKDGFMSPDSKEKQTGNDKSTGGQLLRRNKTMQNQS